MIQFVSFLRVSTDRQGKSGLGLGLEAQRKAVADYVAGKGDIAAADMPVANRFLLHVMARDFDRQVAGLRIRAAILNRFAALGTPQTQRVG